MAERNQPGGLESLLAESDSRAGLPGIVVESLRDKVVASLKNAFFSGQLKPGDTIVERQLAQQLKVGSPAIREALITLQQQGFVQRIANTATYVTSFTMEEVKELYQLRIEFELLAFKWAKLRVRPEDLAHLESLIAEMIRSARTEEAREFFELDLQFHRYCWKLSGNKFLERSLENLVPALFAFVLNASLNTVQETTARQHYHLVSALRSANEPEFTAIIRESLNVFALEAICAVAGKPVFRPAR